MRKFFVFITCFSFGLLASHSAFSQISAVEAANMREDLRLLVQRVGEMNLRLEQLERENEMLRKSQADTNYATITQLNEAVADLNRAIKSGDSATADRAAEQIKKLADATNASIDSLAKAVNQQRTRVSSAPPPTPTTFDDNYPSNGISYTVQRGDTISVIARKTGAKARDIINANKIADPTKLQVGEVLFIPGGK